MSQGIRRATLGALAAGVVIGTLLAPGGMSLASSRSPQNHIDYGHGKMPCGVAANGQPYPPGSGTMSYETTCVIKWRVMVPAAKGTRLVLTDPAGHTTVLNLSHR